MDVLNLLTHVLGFLGGFLTALFAEPLRSGLYRPVLTLQFHKGDHFIARTPEEDESSRHEACYVRVRAMNKRRALAKSCRAYLVNIERLSLSESWEATAYCESMQLAWAGRGDGAYTALDLPKNVPHFIDVLSTREGSTMFRPEIALLFRSESFLSSPGTYRFTILVSGDGVTPASLGLSFKWGGKWDGFEVSEVDPAV